MLCDERSRPDPKEGIALSAKTCDITTADSHKDINEKMIYFPYNKSSIFIDIHKPF